MPEAGPCLIIVPVLDRPQNVQPLLDSVSSATPEPHRVLFVADETDDEEIAAVNAAGGDLLIVPKKRVSYPCKVNSAYESSTEPLLFLAADDIRFRDGWLTEAISHLSETIHVVGTNDLGNARVVAGEHSTHTLVTRAYCDLPGATADRTHSVMHEGYRHWYCDDELVGMAKKRGAFVSATECIVEHLHPYFGKAKKDATYLAGESRKRADLREHTRRRNRWT